MYLLTIKCFVVECSLVVITLHYIKTMNAENIFCRISVNYKLPSVLRTEQTKLSASY